MTAINSTSARPPIPSKSISSNVTPATTERIDAKDSRKTPHCEKPSEFAQNYHQVQTQSETMSTETDQADHSEAKSTQSAVMMDDARSPFTNAPQRSNPVTTRLQEMNLPTSSNEKEQRKTASSPSDELAALIPIAHYQIHVAAPKTNEQATVNIRRQSSELSELSAMVKHNRLPTEHALNSFSSVSEQTSSQHHTNQQTLTNLLSDPVSSKTFNHAFNEQSNSLSSGSHALAHHFDMPPLPGGNNIDKPAWANIPINTSQGKWGEQMLQVLQDRVTLQANHNMQEAHIRLDPPELGKLELMVKVDGDKLNIQINASHAHVREALVQVSERLRHELQAQQFVHVDVNVGSDSSQHSSSQPFEQESDDTYRISEATQTNRETTPDRSLSSGYWLSTRA